MRRSEARWGESPALTLSNKIGALMLDKIAMDEIPFSTASLQLCDTVPPVRPPAPPLPVKRPVSCRLIAWRHDNGLTDTAYETVEHAREAAQQLHWIVYWKYALQCGRDMIERRLIEAPAG